MEPALRTGLNATYRWSPHRRDWYPSPEVLLATLAECGADGLSSKAHHLLDNAFAAQLRRIGKELHVWTVTPGFETLAAHVVVARGADRDRARREVEYVLSERFAIEHTTLPMEEEGDRAPLRVDIPPS